MSERREGRKKRRAERKGGEPVCIQGKLAFLISMGAHELGAPMGMIEDVGDAQAEAERWNSKGQPAGQGVAGLMGEIGSFKYYVNQLPYYSSSSIILV